MSHLLFEYPYSAFATGILDIEQFANELVLNLQQDPCQGAQAWTQVEALYGDLKLKRADRDRLYQLITEFTGYSKPVRSITKPIKPESSPTTETPAAAEDEAEKQTYIAGALDDTHLLHNEGLHEEMRTPAHEKSQPPEESKEDEEADPDRTVIIPHPKAMRSTTTTEQAPPYPVDQKRSDAATEIRQPAIEALTDSNAETVVHLAAPPIYAVGAQHSVQAPISRPVKQPSPTEWVDDTPPSTPKHSTTSTLAQKTANVIAKVPLHIIFPLILLLMLLSAFALQVLYADRIPPTTSPLPTTQSSTTAPNAGSVSHTAPPPALQASILDSPNSQNSSPRMQALYREASQAALLSRLEPLSDPTSALALLSQMIELNSYDPLIRQTRIEIAQAYLKLAKEARLLDQWKQAEQFVDKALYIRNEAALPAALPGT